MEELKNQSVEELKGLYFELSKEIFQLKNEVSLTKKLEKPHRVRLKKKTRARVLTLLNQKGVKINYHD